MGFPIRKSADQSSFAAPRGLSQRSTSFIASQRQGIHQTPLRHLIALIINARPRCRMSDARCQKFSDIRSPTSDLWFSIDRKTSLLRDRPEGARAVKQRLGCGSPATCAAATFSDRSPLHDVRQRARLTSSGRGPRTCGARKHVSFGRTVDPAGGARRDRTDDLLLAKQALSQLSYGPVRGQRSDDRGQTFSSVI